MKVTHNTEERIICLWSWYGSLIAVIEYDENRVITKTKEWKSGAIATLKEKFFYLNLTDSLANTNHLIQIDGIDVIGVLCINDELQGFLSYCSKYSNEPIEMENNAFEVDQLCKQARMFCALHGVNLYMS